MSFIPLLPSPYLMMTVHMGIGFVSLLFATSSLPRRHLSRGDVSAHRCKLLLLFSEGVLFPMAGITASRLSVKISTFPVLLLNLSQGMCTYLGFSQGLCPYLGFLHSGAVGSLVVAEYRTITVPPRLLRLLKRRWFVSVRSRIE